MSEFDSLTKEEQISSLLPLVRIAANSYGWINCKIESINHEFNSTFKITTTEGLHYALRVNVNSQRSKENVLAEAFWINELRKIDGLKVAKPVSNLMGDFVSFIWHAPIGKNLATVAFEWIDGEEVGDKPSPEELRAIGAALARMHEASISTSLPDGAELNLLNDALWHANNNIATSDLLGKSDKYVLSQTLEIIVKVSTELFSRQSPQIIHADVHGWNVMWDGREVTIFDFDDCAIGLPLQDLAVTFYYLDVKDDENYVIEGYESVRPLPKYSEFEMETLIMQRRLILLNYLLETRNPEHRAMVPKYLTATVDRASKFLTNIR